MTNYKLFYGGHELSITCAGNIDSLAKIASQNDHLFALTDEKQLYFGILGSESRTHIAFELIRSDVNDIDCSDDSIYVVDQYGCVQHCPLMAFAFDKHWNDVPIVSYSAIYEGVSTDDFVRVANVHCNSDGVLFTTRDRELYAMGNFGEACTSDQPTKMAQFEKYEVLKVAMGRHFAVVLTRCRTEHKSPRDSGAGRELDDSLNLSDMSVLELPADLPSVAGEQGASLDCGPLAGDAHDVQKTVQAGNDLIQTQVWTFGSVNRGQLGTGDHMHRKAAYQVKMLGEQGVCDVCCGDEHTAALTLDGRLYLWGDNSNEQISHWIEQEQCSSPKRYYKSELSVLRVQCGQFSTLIVATSLERSELSKHKYFDGVQIDGHASAGRPANSFLFLANKQVLAIDGEVRPLLHEKYVRFEQQFLQDILQFSSPFFPKFEDTMIRNPHAKHMLPNYREFFRQHQNIASLTAANIRSMLAYCSGTRDSPDMLFVQKSQAFVCCYLSYTKNYTEITCSNDFQRHCRLMIPNTDFVSKFSTPLHHITNYIDLIEELMAKGATSDALKRAQIVWTQFRIEMNKMLADADRTMSFWQHQKGLPAVLQTPTRRYVTDSRELPLKLLPASRFTSNWFILFDDLFCHSAGSAAIKQYPLCTLWISSVSDKDAEAPGSSSTSGGARKYALKVTTPEEQFYICAQSNEVKMKWFQLIEHHVKMVLGRPAEQKNALVCRVTTHTFTDKHKLYARCKYYGGWYYGKMHGLGYLEYADGRVFTGQFEMGAINGFGRYFVANASCYEGSFRNGKYDGCGNLEVQCINGK